MKRDSRTLSRRFVIAAAIAAGAAMPLGAARGAEAAAPATQPAYPALDQLNRECIALSRELQGSLLRVQVPQPRVVLNNIDNEPRFNRYSKQLDPNVKKALQQRAIAQQQQYLTNNGNYGPPTSQPANADNSNLKNGS